MRKLDKIKNPFPILLIAFVFYDFFKIGWEGIIEMVSDPVFYMIIIGLVLAVLIIVFIEHKISSKAK